MAMETVPDGPPAGPKGAPYWNWYLWWVDNLNNDTQAFFYDTPIAGTIRFTNIASRGDGTKILIKYDEVDM